MRKLGFDPHFVEGYLGQVEFKRNEHGVPVIKAGTIPDLYYGLGWIHAYDRPVALELSRLVAKGCAAEHLDPGLLDVDITMRRYNLWGDSKKQAGKLAPQTMELVEAYCAGVNNRYSRVRHPFEFKLIGYNPQPWVPADCILMTKLIGIIDLTETQGWMQKLIIQMIRHGVSERQLKELFPYITEELTADYLDLIRKIKLAGPIVPETLKWASLPRLQCSNNWVVSGKKSATGKPLLANDIHLDTARLPNIWQEVIMHSGDFYYIGATVPGIPSPAVGRTADLAWAVTYGYMDVIDYFIEDVAAGLYLKGNRRLPFQVREEVIKVKKGKPVTVRFYENEHGVLEQEPTEDGFYLCLAWSAGRNSGAETLDRFRQAVFSKTVKAAMPAMAGLDFASFSWAAADREGNIGYQMSGRCPVRAKGKSGLLPLPGWDEKNDWRGFYDRSMNPSLYNPGTNFVVTANHDLNRHAGVNMISLSMADYRAQRITEMLDGRSDHSVESMQAMHYDLYSKQAELFMEKIRPLLPDNEEGRLLRQWDLKYHSASRAATLFENIYRELSRTVFGTLGLGPAVFDYLVNETILFHDFYGNFDRIMLSDESAWFGGRTGRQVLEDALEKGLAQPAGPYGRNRKIIMKNLLFGGRLPKFLGFDYGPVELIGSRATIPQGQIFKSFGRLATFSPGYKFITDFCEESIHSSLAGGPSDRRFSPWYTSGMAGWISGKYNHLKRP